MKEYVHIALAVIVLAALAAFGYVLISFGEGRVEKKDLAALEQRIKDNAATEERWRQNSDKANQQHDTDLAYIRRVVDTPHPPVIVRIPAGGGTGAAHPGAAAGQPADGRAGAPACAGDTGQTVAIDIGPDLDAIESEWATNVADCRSALAKWPK